MDRWIDRPVGQELPDLVEIVRFSGFERFGVLRVQQLPILVVDKIMGKALEGWQVVKEKRQSLPLP